LEIEELIVCGWDEVFIYNMKAIKGGLPTIVWCWRAKDCASLPEHMKSLFGTTDDCKPIDNGEKILITASSTGVAIVDKKSKEVSFYARVSNAHSAEVLPDNRIVVASSVKSEGHKILVFNRDKSDEVIISEELSHAHGVLWDEKRNCLWALGYTELRKYQLQDWKSDSPKLNCDQIFQLPSQGGHDLLALPDSEKLIITIEKGAFIFDRDTEDFSTYEPLANQVNVKAITFHPESKQMAYVQAEGDNWWAENIHFENPDFLIHVPGEHFYKIRWNCR